MSSGRKKKTGGKVTTRRPPRSKAERWPEVYGRLQGDINDLRKELADVNKRNKKQLKRIAELEADCEKLSAAIDVAVSQTTRTRDWAIERAMEALGELPSEEVIEA